MTDHEEATWCKRRVANLIDDFDHIAPILKRSRDITNELGSPPGLSFMSSREQS